MTGGARGWMALVREVGEAFLALAQAELRALREDLRSSGRGLARALLLLALAAAAAFWSVALLIDLAVELLAMALPRWGAMAVVLAVLIAGVAALAGTARRRLRRLETPAATLRRRLEESRDWWRARIEAEIDDAGEEP